MATDDVTETSISCPCGKGEITITQSSPDHPYVRESQTRTTATIRCGDCANDFVIENSYGSLPRVFRRSDVDAREAAKAERSAAEERLGNSDEVGRLKPRIRDYVLSQKNMAEEHRALQRLGLTIDSVDSYRRRRRKDYDNRYIDKKLGLTTGGVYARIGSMPDLGGDDVEFFKRAADEISALEAAENAIRLEPVKIQSHWFRS